MSRRERRSFVLFVTLLATLVTSLSTSPLIFLWQTHLAGFHGSDAFAHTWSLWWFDRALSRWGQSPAWVNFISYPTPFHHPIFVAASYARLVTLPLVHWGGPVVAYNAHLFVSFVSTWVLMALLCVELTGNRAAAVVGGAIFTFCPSRIVHALHGHFTQTLTYFWPLMVLCLWRLLKRPGIGRGVVFGLTLILACSVDLMPAAYFAIPVVAGVWLFFLLDDRTRVISRAGLRGLAAAFSVAVAVLVPIMWPLLSSAMGGRMTFYHAGGTVEYSADALALVIPPPRHPICQVWPGLQALSVRTLSFGLSYTESVVYVGWLTLALAAVGVVSGWRRWRDVRLWVVVAGGASLLALGPVLRVGGRLVRWGSQPIFLPYQLVKMMPLLSWGRTPARLNMTAMFALAILAAYGVAWLLRRVCPFWQQVLALGVVTMALIDYAVLFPWPMTDISVPPFYEELAADRRSVAVLDMPVWNYTANHFFMLYQMTHGHAIVGGYIYRRPAEAEEAMAELESLARPGGDPRALADYGIGYVVLHCDFLESADLEALTAHLAGRLGPPVYEDERIVAFAVPGALEVAPPPLEVDQ